MSFGLLSIWAALMLSCALPSSFTVKARHVAFKLQRDLHHKKEEQSFFQDAYVRKSSEDKLAATQFKVSVQDSAGHNDAHKIKGVETLASNDSGTQIFSRHPNKSMNKNAAAKKKGIAMMAAFRPSSSGHSPGIGHDNPPDPRV